MDSIKVRDEKVRDEKVRTRGLCRTTKPGAVQQSSSRSLTADEKYRLGSLEAAVLDKERSHAIKKTRPRLQNGHPLFNKSSQTRNHSRAPLPFVADQEGPLTPENSEQMSASKRLSSFLDEAIKEKVTSEKMNGSKCKSLASMEFAVHSKVVRNGGGSVPKFPVEPYWEDSSTGLKLSVSPASRRLVALEESVESKIVRENETAESSRSLGHLENSLRSADNSFRQWSRSEIDPYLEDITTNLRPDEEMHEQAPISKPHRDRRNGNTVVAINITELDSTDIEAIPRAIEYDPDAKQPLFHKRSRFLCYAIVVAIVVVVVLVVGISVAVKAEKDDGKSNAEVPYRETIGIRESIESVVGRERMADRTSPYVKALDWITHNDPMELLPTDLNFIQRYTATYFYYATSMDRWDYCQPPTQDDSNNCEWTKTNKYGETTTFQGKRWLSSLNECNWLGVYCDLETGQIIKIYIENVGMKGTFPEGVVFLPMLQELRLNWGKLTGTLPGSLVTMKHLTVLNLAQQQFTGPIPREWYKWRNLKELHLTDNRLSGSISKDVAKWNLEALYLTNNNITGSIPDAIGGMLNIQYMSLSDNRLTGSIPATIGRLRHLEDLRLEQNVLTGILPLEIGTCTSMANLRLGFNRLSSILPSEIYKLTAMQAIYLSNNNFNGTISTSVRKLTNLRVLQLDNNDFSGVLPAEIGELTMIQRLDISGNDFTGSIPTELCALRDNRFNKLIADCGGHESSMDAAEIVCQRGCCTHCCDVTGMECAPAPP